MPLLRASQPVNWTCAEKLTTNDEFEFDRDSTHPTVADLTSDVAWASSWKLLMPNIAVRYPDIECVSVAFTLVPLLKAGPLDERSRLKLPFVKSNFSRTRMNCARSSTSTCDA